MAGNRKSHRIRAKMQGTAALVKVLIRHPMETGRRKDKLSGEQIPRHFIRELRCEHNGLPVLIADWSWGIASNPYLSFRILDARPGDEVRIAWSDNQGREDAVATQVI